MINVEVEHLIIDKVEDTVKKSLNDLEKNNRNIFCNSKDGMKIEDDDKRNEAEKASEGINQIVTGSEDDLLDEDLIARFNRLKNFTGDTPANNDDTLSSSGFENYLDNFDKNIEKTISIGEFTSNRISLSGSMNNTNIGYSYSDAANTPKKVEENKKVTQHRKNEIRFQGNVSANATLPIIDKDGYTLKGSKAEYRKRRNNEFNLVGAPSPLTYVWVYKVMSGTADNIANYIRSRNINVDQVVRISHIDAKYKSFKIAVNKFDSKKLLDRNFWPQGFMCKIWREFDKNRINSVSYVSRKYQLN